MYKLLLFKEKYFLSRLSLWNGFASMLLPCVHVGISGKQAGFQGILRRWLQSRYRDRLRFAILFFGDPFIGNSVNSLRLLRALRYFNSRPERTFTYTSKGNHLTKNFVLPSGSVRRAITWLCKLTVSPELWIRPNVRFCVIWSSLCWRPSIIPESMKSNIRAVKSYY